MTAKKYTSQEIARLILLSLHHRAEEEQEAELRRWLDESEDNRRFYETFKSRAYREANWEEYVRYNSRNDWNIVKSKMVRRQKSIFRRFMPYAAMLILAIGIVAIVELKQPQGDTKTVIAGQPIVPGGSKAMLVLPDGRHIELESGGDSLCRKMEGENFVNDGKQLAYNGRPENEEVQLHTLKTPRGGEYRLILSDGTKVWLNAESELVYPDHFVENKRQVILNGEAYFEVAKDPAKPFHVRVRDMVVEVLGTSFHVSGYPGEQRRTTLVEGSVAVSLNQQQIEILPGQQAAETAEGLMVSRVNLANYAGGRDRRFVYENRLLEDVFKDLERWYDVELFVANDEIRNLHLTANLPKYENMDKVLEIIEYAACVRFEVKGRTVVVRLVK